MNTAELEEAVGARVIVDKGRMAAFEITSKVSLIVDLTEHSVDQVRRLVKAKRAEVAR